MQGDPTASAAGVLWLAWAERSRKQTRESGSSHNQHDDSDCQLQLGSSGTSQAAVRLDASGVPYPHFPGGRRRQLVFPGQQAENRGWGHSPHPSATALAWKGRLTMLHVASSQCRRAMDQAEKQGAAALIVASVAPAVPKLHGYGQTDSISLYSTTPSPPSKMRLDPTLVTRKRAQHAAPDAGRDTA